MIFSRAALFTNTVGIANRVDKGVLIQRLIEVIALDIAIRIDALNQAELVGVLNTDERDFNPRFFCFFEQLTDVIEFGLIGIDVIDRPTVDLDFVEAKLLQNLHREITARITVADQRSIQIGKLLLHRLEFRKVIGNILFWDFQSDETLRHMHAGDQIIHLLEEVGIGEERIVGIKGEATEAKDTEDRGPILLIYASDVIKQGAGDKTDFIIRHRDTYQFVRIEDDLAVIVGNT